MFFLENLLQQIPFLFKLLGIGAFSFILCFFAIKYFLKIVNEKGLFRQPIRSDGPESHIKEKQNTPTMGGLMILLSTLISTIFFSDLGNNYVWITLFVFISFAVIGFIDDFVKVTGGNSRGFKGSFKLIIQFVIVSIVILVLQNTDNVYYEGVVAIPFSDSYMDLGLVYLLFATLVIVGSANSVNLTDGLDGLVSVPSIVSLVSLSLIIYLVAQDKVAEKLNIININYISELLIFCVSLIGAILAFLKFNLKPAKIFMGDVGSLSIGAALGTLAVILKQELVFAIIALLFIIEALSVMIQVVSYKIRKKRVFLMAPIHHHFEKLGWREVKVVKRFWIASIIFAIIGLLGLLI